MNSSLGRMDMKYLFTTIFLLFPLIANAAKPPYGPYRAEVVKIKDGDTVLLDVALWPGLTKRISLRLKGINTPEKRGKGITACEKAAAQKATEFTQRFLKDTKYVFVSGVKLGKYAGRALGSISNGKKDLGMALLEAGLARQYDGGKREAWCK